MLTEDEKENILSKWNIENTPTSDLWKLICDVEKLCASKYSQKLAKIRKKYRGASNWMNIPIEVFDELMEELK